MARSARRLAGYRPVRETFRGIRWDRKNRLWHERYTRTDPRFSAACKLDWSRVLKRPDTRYADGRQLGIVARDLGFRRVVYFLTYVKRNGFFNVISIRYAETSEEILFFVTTRDDTPPAPEKARRVVRVKQSPGEMPTDADAARALAWLARGKPQSEIVHDNGAPKQTKADLAKFRQASYRREKG